MPYWGTRRPRQNFIIMQKTKYLLTAGIALALVVSAYLISIGIRHFQGGDPVVRVTGLSERHITSDLIILPIRITTLDKDQAKAYQALQSAKNKAMAFLQAQGLGTDEVSASSVAITKDEAHHYNRSTYAYESTTFNGYNLSMELTIRSSKVAVVEKISSTISELISAGVSLSVRDARYYYTKLNELKSEMIKEASSDAHARAQLIAEGGKKKLGDLKGTTLGVFQVVGLYEDEAYSWGGSFNTKSKEKTISVTVKASYIID